MELYSKRAKQPAVIFLQDTKAAQRNHLLWEKVLIYEETGLAALELLCQHRRPDAFLVDEQPPRFSKSVERGSLASSSGSIQLFAL